MNIDSNSYKRKYLENNLPLKMIHESFSPYVFLNMECVKLTEDTPILDVILVNEVSIIIKLYY